MDLNRLYSDHQVLLMQADHAGPGLAGRSLRGDAQTLAGRIASYQEGMGAAAASAWKAQSVRLGTALSAALTARGLAA
ncbi:hypothetical protein [Alteraurantiacibacter buctensis]|uniref:Uncharacterized protein n=1 Tax=Alteraurantiacibacter buctensis TaxID=1503981 RepID=A0A844YRU6_9SPHN|nr:hypothetical protein [Alteraurantiacibacter buctensis]MXO71075.1 hypothetical protein [Alteraurantiacibacter buctensis]